MTIRNAQEMISRKPTSVLAVCVLAVSALLVVGCDSVTDFDEINKNPNDPPSAPSEQVLSGLLANFSYEVVGNAPVRVPSLWIQQAAQNVDQPEADVYLYESGDPNNLWEFSLYAGTMKDALVLQETAIEEGNFASAGIGQVIEAWQWMILTDLWGDVPVTEAFQNDIRTPSYDDQEVAYERVFAKLDSARSNLNKGNKEPLGANDLLYGGDLSKWKSLAWALEAKAHIHLTESGFGTGLNNASSQQARAQAALDAAQKAFPGGISDMPVFEYPGGDNGENPWYQFTIQNVWVTTHQVNEDYITLLKDQKDPRLGIQARQVGEVDDANTPPTAGADTVREAFDPSSDFEMSDSTYVGHENASDRQGDQNVSSIGRYYSAPDAPLVWMNYAELKFIEAEARVITGSGNAAQAYEEGIEASLEQLNVKSLEGVDQAFVDNFVSEQMSDYNSASNKIQEIIEEKYIANFLGLEPFNDWRRTGYPNLTPVPSDQAETDGGVIPVRFPYPESEFSNNGGQVPTDIGTGVNSLDAPVDWDK